MNVLKDKGEDPNVRSSAVRVLNRIGEPAQVAIPILISQLEDKQENAQVRENAGVVLGQMGSNAKPAIPALLNALRDEDSHVRLGAISGVEQLGPEAKEAIPLLVTALRDKDQYVREAAAEALGSMGPEARPSVGVLISLLKDDDSHVRQAAGRTIARFAEGSPESISLTLIKALGNQKDPGLGLYPRSDELSDSNEREGAAYALGFFGGNPKLVVPALILALNDREDDVRLAAAVSLGRLGVEARTAVLPLAALIENPGSVISSGAAAEALKRIAIGLREGKHYEMIGELKQAEEILEKSPRAKGRYDEQARVVRETISYLQLVRRNELWYRALQPIRKNPKFASGVGAYGLLTIFTFLMLWLSPLAILRINEGLRPYMDVPIPIGFGGIKIPLRHVLLIGFFHYHPRVLDRWISKRITTVRDEFRKMTTVRDREIHVQIPVVLDEKVIVGLDVEHLRGVFEKRRACVLIWGEGGAGKTSLACEIGSWAMQQDRAKRLRKHLMIPILIEHDLDFNVGGNANSLAARICGQLKVLANEEIAPSEELVNSLLIRQRILVIVDGLSELGVSTRDVIRPSDPKFSANALVVTSRLKEHLEGLSRTNIKPMRIEGNRLSSFMEAYLTQRSKRELFDDTEFFVGCSKLSSLVDRRNITVLLAKLYAEQMIGLKDGTVQSHELPGTIPELMLEYVNRLISASGKENEMTEEFKTLLR